MRFRTKITVAVLAAVFFTYGAAKTFEFAKEKYLYKAVAATLRGHFYKKYNANLYVGGINGSIIRDLSLRNISISRIKGCPADLSFESDSAYFSYKPFGILFGRLSASFENPRFVYKKIVLPLVISHTNGITTIIFDKRSLNLENLEEFLPENISFSGWADVKGEVMLKDLKPHLLSISINGLDLQLIYKTRFGIRANAMLEVSGAAARPVISGNINVTEFSSLDTFSVLRLLENKENYVNAGIPKNLTLDISINGKGIFAKNHCLDARFDSDAKLIKEKNASLYLLGKIEVQKGNYKIYNDRFAIKKGEIVFGGKDKEPEFNFSAQAKIRKHAIYARLKGTARNHCLLFSSDPELSEEEIASLVIFNKYIKELTIDEQKRLQEKPEMIN